MVGEEEGNDEMEFFAHSENAFGQKHELKKHLEGTAGRASSFAPSEDLRPLFYLAGLLHDAGKFQDGFQKYLEHGKPKTPHAAIGAYIARTFAKHQLPLPFVIKGHHAGMPDKQALQTTLIEYASEEDSVAFVRARFEETFSDVATLFCESKNPKVTDRLLLECTTRFLFSALTDADWLDTERHFSSAKSEARVSAALEYETLIKALETKFAQLPTDGAINALRTRARKESAAHFNARPGFFSLQLPTGLGKTLTSVYWALLHARQNKLKRIIIVLPYLNIIDQTALILKEVFGEYTILEHHSGMVEEDNQYKEEEIDKSSVLAQRLACENWDAPIIVTTSVQFFESLFSNRPFKCRKNHNIAESVVIFDEIQTLPKHLVEPTVVMLKNVAQLAHVSFLFCTATLPAFAKREGFDGIETIVPLIEKPEKYFAATQRVRYRLVNKLEPISFDAIQEKLSKENDSFLVIMNTKVEARELFRRIKELRQYERWYHLSTAMCPHHRKKIIKHITEDLDKKRRIAVVSTQLVEAGVDLDFPCVYRAIAPMDAVIQSAGRCNRNGTVKKKGRVSLFKLEGQRMPDETYRACAGYAETIIKDDVNLLHEADAFKRYYESVISLFVNADKYKIRDDREDFNFQTVNDKYRIIDERTVPLIIARYSSESEALLNELKERMDFASHTQEARNLLRRLQQYSVQVYPKFLQDYNGQIETHKDILRIWLGNYDDDIGLAPSEVETVF